MNELITIFKSCLDILRNEENLTGGNALNNLTYILTLKLIEPHINKEIFFDTFDYDLDYITDINDRNEHKLKLLNLVKFSNLIIEQEYNLVTNIKYLWSDILSFHPATKSIFLSNKQFNIEKASSFIKLFKKINSIDVLNIEYDVLGSAYEEVVRDVETGKVFGQFFTQPSIKNLMIKLINPQINPDGTFETCADPAMGTGGFLISYLKQILKQSKEKNININWDFVIKNGLY